MLVHVVLGAWCSSSGPLKAETGVCVNDGRARPVGVLRRDATADSLQSLDGEEQRSCFSAEMLTEIAERFDDLETELWRVKRAIEQRAKGDDA
jgi:hypothetical protein